MTQKRIYVRKQRGDTDAKRISFTIEWSGTSRGRYVGRWELATLITAGALSVSLIGARLLHITCMYTRIQTCTDMSDDLSRDDVFRKTDLCNDSRRNFASTLILQISLDLQRRISRYNNKNNNFVGFRFVEVRFLIKNLINYSFVFVVHYSAVWINILGMQQYSNYGYWLTNNRRWIKDYLSNNDRLRRLTWILIQVFVHSQQLVKRPLEKKVNFLYTKWFDIPWKYMMYHCLCSDVLCPPSWLLSPALCRNIRLLRRGADIRVNTIRSKTYTTNATKI